MLNDDLDFGPIPEPLVHIADLTDLSGGKSSVVTTLSLSRQWRFHQLLKAGICTISPRDNMGDSDSFVMTIPCSDLLTEEGSSIQLLQLPISRPVFHAHFGQTFLQCTVRKDKHVPLRWPTPTYQEKLHQIKRERVGKTNLEGPFAEYFPPYDDAKNQEVANFLYGEWLEIRISPVPSWRRE
tara:strand:+ start:32793 stop:33338 length:546 start_codon:yes stop_codon:yes gene_type:complete